MEKMNQEEEDDKNLFVRRWIGFQDQLKGIIPIIKTDSNWHKSEPYQSLMKMLPPLPMGIEIEEADLRGAPLSETDLEGAKLHNANLKWADLTNAVLSRADLSGASLTYADLSLTRCEEADLSGAFLGMARLLKTKLYKAKLQGASLEGAELSNAVLGNANIKGANLSGADLSGAFIMRADLSEANLEDADLSGASLANADLSEANLREAKLSGAILENADLSGANLTYADLSEADLTQIKYTKDEVFDRLTKWWIPKLIKIPPGLRRLQYVQKLKPIEITNFRAIDTSKLNSSTNPVLKRHIDDYQFILGFKEKSCVHQWLFYPLWKGTSDCGRSLLLWLIWSVGLVWVFTGVYSYYLRGCFSPGNLKWFDFLYFSVVTFTTLGFGDVHPQIGQPNAQLWVMFEVIIGYIMLGGLISILANKLARRA